MLVLAVVVPIVSTIGATGSAIAGPPWPGSEDRMVVPAGSFGHPSVAAAADGRLVVALTSYHPTAGLAVRVLRSDPDVTSFTQIGLFWDPDPIVSYSEPDVAILEEGGLIVLTLLEQIFGGFEVMAYTTPLDGPPQWTSSLVMSGADLLEPRLVAYESGANPPELHVIARAVSVVAGGAPDAVETQLYYARSVDSGTSWSEPALLGAEVFPAEIVAPSLAAGMDDHLHVVYAAGPEDDHVLRYVHHGDSGDPATAWDDPVTLAEPASDVLETDVAAGDESPHVWAVYRTADGEVRLAWSPNAGDLFPLIDHVIVPSQSDPSHARVMAIGDEAHLVFRIQGFRLFYRSLPLINPMEAGFPSRVSDVGEPVTVPYDVYPRPGSGPAVIWLQDGVAERAAYVDAFWFPPSAGIAPPAGEAAAPPQVIARTLPNPFAATLSIELEMGRAGPATVQVYDIAGRLVRRLAERSLAAGNHRITWDGRADNGLQTPAGTYFLVATTDRGRSSVRVTRLR